MHTVALLHSRSVCIHLLTGEIGLETKTLLSLVAPPFVASVMMFIVTMTVIIAMMISMPIPRMPETQNHRAVLFEPVQDPQKRHGH